MKNIYYLVFFLISISSCRTVAEHPQKITFGFVETFKLDNDEREYSLNELIINEYENFIYFDDFNLPLNKFINGKNYKIFISAAVENNEEELLHKLIYNANPFNLIEKKKDGLFTSLFLSKEDFYVIQIIYSERKQKIPFLISMVSNDSILLKNIYDEKLLLSKIN